MTPIVRLRDVARLELGAQQYDQSCLMDGQPSVGLAVYQIADGQRAGYGRRHPPENGGTQVAVP